MEKRHLDRKSSVASVLLEIEALASLSAFTLQDMGTKPEHAAAGLMCVQERIEDLAASLRDNLDVQLQDFRPTSGDKLVCDFVEAGAP